jgi:hypothetical protein
MRVFSTSEGTYIIDAARSPKDPAHKWAMNSGIALAVKVRLVNSYVPKYRVVPGIEPSIAGVTPAYRPLNMPSSFHISL